MWILGNAAKDLTAFYLLPVIYVTFIAFGKIPEKAFVFILPIIVLLDSAHVYSTNLRTYFRADEFKRSKIHIYFPILIILIGFLWNYLGVAYFWTAYLYLTYYHHVRQYYGVMKWYDFKKKSSMAYQQYWLYTLIFFPFIAFHFGEYSANGLNIKNELPNLFNDGLFVTLSYINIGLIVGFCIYSFVNRAKLSLASFLSILIPACIHFSGFVLTKDYRQIFYPLMIIHGITYFFLISLSIKRTDKRVKNNFMIAFATVIIFSLACALVERNSIHPLVSLKKSNANAGDFLNSFFTILMVTPTLLHYFIDAYIWRRHHPDFKRVLE